VPPSYNEERRAVLVACAPHTCNRCSEQAKPYKLLWGPIRPQQFPIWRQLTRPSVRPMRSPRPKPISGLRGRRTLYAEWEAEMLEPVTRVSAFVTEPLRRWASAGVSPKARCRVTR
jgi:hypothetical protein